MKLKKVEVIWVDTICKHGWYYASEIKDLKLPEITEIGYLFSKDEENVVLVAALDGEERRDFADIHLIPMGCVKEIRDI